MTSLRRLHAFALAGSICCGCEDLPPSGEALPVDSIVPTATSSAARVEREQMDERASLDVAAEAVSQLSRSPSAAEAAFGQLGSSCAGLAGLAYLAWDRGDTAAAIEHWRLARLLRDARFCDLADAEPLGIQILTALRHSLEALAGNDVLKTRLPCTVFEHHPAEAFAAHESYWGSTKDLPGFDAERDCARASLRSSVPSMRLGPILDALDEAFRTPEHLINEPSGTMWISAGYSVRRPIAQVMIAPELTRPNPDLAKRRSAAVAEARKRVPGFSARLAALEKSRRRLVPLLAEGVCGVATRRGWAPSTERCGELAGDAFDHAQLLWLEAEPWAAFYMEGGP